MTLAQQQSVCPPTNSMEVEVYEPTRRACVRDHLFNWTRSSAAKLREVERKILSYLKIPYRGYFVRIGSAEGREDKLWTISMNTESKETPLVMLHGFGAGVALWVMNLDALGRDRPVYAMDLLGFGRSSRPTFAKDPQVCEKQLVNSVEEWRREMNIPKMILLGHSMGGFLASSYALSYPDRVKHLILADPWGFPEKPSESARRRYPLWVRGIAFVLMPLNPLWVLRAAGPFGERMIKRARGDIMRKFADAVEEEDLLPQYIHQCNSQRPSGESAFHTMMEAFGWAKHPMAKRIIDLRKDVSMTFIFGEKSWINSSFGAEIKAERSESSVDIKTIIDAGHHVYADRPEVFNRYVTETCEESDRRVSSEFMGSEEDNEKSASTPQEEGETGESSGKLKQN